MRPRVNIESVAQILSQPRLRLAVGRYVDFDGCHCAAGELASKAGVDNDTLRAADAVTNHGQYIVDSPTTREPFERACKAIDDALRRAYGITPEDRDVITWENDHAECDIAARPGVVLARFRDHCTELEASGAYGDGAS
jgi:hypothetical protein